MQTKDFYDWLVQVMPSDLKDATVLKNIKKGERILGYAEISIVVL